MSFPSNRLSGACSPSVSPVPPVESVTATGWLEDVRRLYAIKTTPFLDKMLEGLPEGHPLIRQFRPAAEELVVAADDVSDPIGDAVRSPVAGIVHRYPDRVLLKPSHICAAYCRFCFRREQVGPQGEFLSESQMQAALAYIAAHPAIWEVVLTGGDPLLLSARRLRLMLSALEDIPHVGTVRIHTRLPLHDPQAVDGELLEVLREERRFPLWIAVHFNHPDELVPEVCSALKRLHRAGVPLVSQTVLLRGVNDSVETLAALFRALVCQRVKPYYLHHPDLAPGTSHFRLPVEEGRALFDQLYHQLSGLARPTYILDRPGGLGKVPLYP